MISKIKVPESNIARQAEEFARSVSNDMLFNHVMRCYFFGELIALSEGVEVDHELMFLSAVLHDLGLTRVGQGSHRFEIEGANAARAFLLDKGTPNDRAWRVWDNIALHTWDINLFRDDTSRLLERGIQYDVRGLKDMQLDPSDVEDLILQYPRLEFKRGFYELLRREVDSKQPYEHSFHLCMCVAHNQLKLTLPDAKTVLNGAPFDD
jgi:hypothetical protein